MNQRSLFIESGADASGLVAAAVIPKTIGTPAAGLSVLEPLVSRVIKPLEDYGQCSFEGCDRIEQQRGLCAAHARQRWAGKSLTPLKSRPRRMPSTCTFPECDKPHRARGLCASHYSQQVTHGTTRPLGWLEPSPVELFSEHAEVIMFDKFGNESGRAIIDLDDVDRVSSRRWFLNKKTQYAACHSGGGKDDTSIYMHVFLAGVDGKQVDHFDGDRLNNRRSNLAEVTPGQNCQNVVRPGRERLRNVYFDKRSRLRPWYAMVQINRKAIIGGYFATQEEAIEAARALRAKVFTHHNEDRHV